MNKKIHAIFIVTALIFSFSFASALTKPGPDANIDNLSYAFYLYYDNGQILADRDYEIKYDVIDEVFLPGSPDPALAYKAEIINFKSEVVKTFVFDPKMGNPGFMMGKIVVKGPYVADGLRTQFYNNSGQQLLSIFVNAGSICNDDGSCNSVTGENEKTCSNDCKTSRATPVPPVTETTGFLQDFDLMTLITYAVGGIGIAVLVWFGWRWWKKKKEGSFLPPPPPPSPPAMSVFPSGSSSNLPGLQ